MASISLGLDVIAPEIQPAEIYGKEGEVRLRVATGGIGATGLLKALAEAFLQNQLETSTTFKSSPWTIAWLLTDTSLSYNALATRSADIAITFHPYADQITAMQGVTERREYIFRDSFCLVGKSKSACTPGPRTDDSAGPQSNPAKLPLDGNLTIYELFALIFCAAVESQKTPNNAIRFLSRYDKSANNIIESRIWSTIGQTPWADPLSGFYHRFNGFPLASVRAANDLGEYCLVDRGTWYSCDPELKKSLVSFKEGAIDGHDAASTSFEDGQSYVLNDDSLNNPAHALLGKHAHFKKEGALFMDWLVRDDGGRKIVQELKWNSIQGYGLPPKASE